VRLDLKLPVFLVLISFVALVLFTSHSQAGTWHYVTTIQPKLYVSASINVNNGLALIVYSSSPITVMVMTPSQFSAFQAGYGSKAVYSAVGTSINTFLNLSSGQYYLVLYNNVSQSATQVSYFAITRPAPTGIADYGLAYSSGSLTPYTVTFNEVVGQVNVLGPTGGYDVNSSNTAYTIQLNAVVLVSTQSGYQELWAQDVAQVNGNELAFADNIWNFTAPGASVQASSVSGKGSVITYNGRGLYAYSTQSIQLPSAFSLMMSVKQTSSGQVTISFGYALGDQPIQWYDNVTVTFSSPVNGAYFLVSGSQMTGDYHAFDAELVLGGGSSASNYYFTSADVGLSMYFLSGGNVVYPKTLFMFGIDTAEGAEDLYTTSGGNVQVGYSYTPYVSSQNVVAPLKIAYFSYSNYVDSLLSKLRINVSVTGGVQPYSLTLNVNGPDYKRSFALSYSNGPYGYGSIDVNLGNNLQPGTYFAQLKVTDSQGSSVTENFTFTVVPPPSVFLTSNSSVYVSGSPVEFTANVTGGAPPISLIWLVDGRYVGSGQTLIHTFSAPGVYNVTVIAMDSWGVKAIKSVLINVLPPLSVSIVSPYTTVDVNVSFTLHAEVTTGSPPFNFTWIINGEVIGQGQNLTISFPQPGTYNVTVIVNSHGLRAVDYVLIRVNPPLEVNAPLNVTAEQGVPFRLVVNASGGTPPYKLFVNGSETSRGVIELSLNETGKVRLNLTVVDAGGGRVSKLLEVTLVPHVRAAIVAPYPTLDQGSSMTLKANVSGGLGPYHIAWVINGVTLANRSEVNVTGSVLGNLSVVLVVEDSLGGNWTTHAIVQVVPKPVLKASLPNVTDVGIPLKLSYSIEYGTRPYELLVLVNGSPANTSLAFDRPGVYSIKVIAKDAFNATSEVDLEVKVNPPLKVDIKAPRYADVGVKLALGVNVTGGTPPYVMRAYVNGTELNSSSFTLNVVGIYNLTVVVEDSIGGEVTRSFLISAVPKPTISLLTTTGSSFLTYNNTITVTPVVVGGVNDSLYVYLNGKLVAQLRPNESYTLSLPVGTNSINVSVVDAFGQSSWKEVEVTTGYNSFNIGGSVAITVVSVVVLTLVLSRIRKP
jgi:thermopsin